MAESESGQDKTEDPTEKRKKDSREKGEIARSKELNTVATMMAGSGALLIYGGGLALDLMELMKHNFSLPREVLLSPDVYKRQAQTRSVSSGGGRGDIGDSGGHVDVAEAVAPVTSTVIGSSAVDYYA